MTGSIECMLRRTPQTCVEIASGSLWYVGHLYHSNFLGYPEIFHLLEAAVRVLLVGSNAFLSVPTAVLV